MARTCADGDPLDPGVPHIGLGGLITNITALTAGAMPRPMVACLATNNSRNTAYLSLSWVQILLLASVWFQARPFILYGMGCWRLTKTRDSHRLLGGDHVSPYFQTLANFEKAVGVFEARSVLKKDNVTASKSPGLSHQPC